MWKEKCQRSKGDQCSFRQESNDRAQKPDDNAATPSEPFLVTRSKCVEEKKYPRQESPWSHSSTIEQILFERYLFANALRILASSRVPFFTKQKRVAKPGISVCSRIIKLMNNRTKRRRRVTVPTKEERATTIMLWQL